MKPVKLLRTATWLVCAACVPLVHASDFTGVYARIDRVVLEPNADSPERIQLWGVFSMAKPNDRNDYLAPARGYLYFKLDQNPRAARNEWNDLKKVAGSGEIVAFGARSSEAPRLRKPDEMPRDPDPYAVNVGVTKVRGRTDYAPVRALLDFKD
jgi:hypothetical protein